MEAAIKEDAAKVSGEVVKGAEAIALKTEELSKKISNMVEEELDDLLKELHI